MPEPQPIVRQLKAARLYTRDLLRTLAEDDWFREDPAGVTHIAWQVGHLAFAQYALALKRIRGEQLDDTALISAEFLAAFGRGSVPNVQHSRNLGVAGIREVLDRVHRQALQELSNLSAAYLEEPAIGPPHAMFKTRRGALEWCVQHEFIHAGQIALLRRQFGGQPLR